MHKGIILLVKNIMPEKIADKVDEFMKPYGDGKVWDWYVIGGRWHNTLAPQKKAKAWKLKADELCPPDKDGHIRMSVIDGKELQLQEAWEQLGLQGKNPYYSNYKLGEDGDYYDIINLRDCIDTVKDWVKDVEAEKIKVWDKMLAAKEKKDSWDMAGYYAGEYYDLTHGQFCFETNVYNISTEEAETIPEDIEQYYAVMIDIHN